MNADHRDNDGVPEGSYTDSTNTVIYIDDSPGDNTRRPWPPDLPRGWYPRPKWRQPPDGQEPPTEPRPERS
jgi:hypothetical protein